jgi:YD repeat-containing protein
MHRCLPALLFLLLVHVARAQVRYEHHAYYYSLPEEVLFLYKNRVAEMQVEAYGEWYRRKPTDSVVRSYYPSGRLQKEAAFNINEGYPVWHKEYADNKPNHLLKETWWSGVPLKPFETSYAYDETGMTAAVWQQDGIPHKRTFRRELDKTGNIAREQRWLDGVMEYDERFQYDNNGRKIRIDHYDAAGNLTDHSIYTYTADGRLLEESDFHNAQLKVRNAYTYDAQGLPRVISSYNSGNKLERTRSFDYDGSGRKTAMVERYPNGVVSARYHYQYHKNGNLAEENWGSRPDYVLRSFDPNGNRVDHRSNYRDTFMIERSRSAITDSVVFHPGPPAYAIKKMLDAKGRVTAMLGREAYRTVYQYDQRGRVTAILNYDGDRIMIAVDLLYDAVGRLVSAIEKQALTGRYHGVQSREYTYTYDKPGRLVREEVKTGTELLYVLSWTYAKNSLLGVSLRHLGNNFEYKYTFRPDGLLHSYYNSSSLRTILYSYRFDEKGNWIERLEEKQPADAYPPGRIFRVFKYR